jgi:hypothetical protein
MARHIPRVKVVGLEKRPKQQDNGYCLDQKEKSRGFSVESHVVSLLNGRYGYLGIFSFHAIYLYFDEIYEHH